LSASVCISELNVFQKVQNEAMSGNFAMGGTSYPFSGMITENSTFYDGDVEGIQETLNFSSDLGPITGTVYATGLSTLVPTPEPSALVLVGLGTLSLLAYGWRHQRRPE
jgi:hypothetical protein